MLFDAIKEMGIKNIRWFPTASFPVHSHLIKYLEDGTIHHIEGSMNGPLGKFTSEGKMKGVGVLRSHGGRYQSFKMVKFTLILLLYLHQLQIHLEMQLVIAVNLLAD